MFNLGLLYANSAFIIQCVVLYKICYALPSESVPPSRACPRDLRFAPVRLAARCPPQAGEQLIDSPFWRVFALTLR